MFIKGILLPNNNPSYFTVIFDPQGTGGLKPIKILKNSYDIVLNYTPDYNMIEKSLGEFVDSKYDPENYLGQGEGTK